MRKNNALIYNQRKEGYPMDITILPPKGCNPEDIKTVTTTEKGVTTILMIYPNGFTVTGVSKDGKQTLTPSGQLIDLGNGIYQVPN